MYDYKQTKYSITFPYYICIFSNFLSSIATQDRNIKIK